MDGHLQWCLASIAVTDETSLSSVEDFVDVFSEPPTNTYTFEANGDAVIGVILSLWNARQSVGPSILDQI